VFYLVAGGNSNRCGDLFSYLLFHPAAEKKKGLVRCFQLFFAHVTLNISNVLLCIEETREERSWSSET
jgi:hypothetical protein